MESYFLRCNLRDFPDKVINDPDFLHLLTVHLLDLADQNPADEPVQHRLVQFFNGGIAPNFLDKGANSAQFSRSMAASAARLCTYDGDSSRPSCELKPISTTSRAVRPPCRLQI